jgi:hypothetical protein
MSARNHAIEILEHLVENGVSEGDILNHIVNNYLSGTEAFYALESAKIEFLDEEEEEDEEDEDDEDYNSALLYGVDSNQ